MPTKKQEQLIEPIHADFEEVARAVSKPQVATRKINKNKDLGDKNALQLAAPKQVPLDLGIEVQREIDGVEMGVLGNGIPFLTQRGLSTATGIFRNAIQEFTTEWEVRFDEEVIGKDRIAFFKQYLFSNGYRERKLYIETIQNGVVHFAYPDLVCMAFLEYYAFESKAERSTALENYRRFARFGLGKFIYESLHYTPGDKWKFHHDRVSLLKDSAPDGYFTIFQESTGLIIDLIAADLPVNHHTVSDISVGSHWATYWKEHGLEAEFGERIPYEHNYPDYYPQAQSNPQKPKAYPDAALPIFRKWFKQVYLLTKFPAYMLTKAKLLPGGKAAAVQIGGMYQDKALPPPEQK